LTALAKTNLLSFEAELFEKAAAAASDEPWTVIMSKALKLGESDARVACIWSSSASP
jgi:hypothetical protein